MTAARGMRPGRVGQRGQAAVLSALCLFSMVVFVALATNMGVLVSDRMRMQNTADLTAYAGGFEQARTMNEIAYLNEQAYNQVQQLRGVLNYGPMYVESDAPDEAAVFYWPQPECSCLDYSPAAQQQIEKWQRRIDATVRAIGQTNSEGQQASKAAATYTAAANFLGANTGNDHLSFFEYLGNSPTSNPDQLVDLGRVEDTMVGYNYLRSCRCCAGCCLYPQVHTESIKTWIFKNPNSMVFFPVKVKGVPLKNFLNIAHNADNPNANDTLYGYAVSKPYEGIIGTRDPDNSNTGGGLDPQGPVYPPSEELVDYFHDTYRARMAGVQENMGSSNQPRSMADLIRQDYKEPQFQDRAEYFTH